jgi:hypothetical protein
VMPRTGSAPQLWQSKTFHWLLLLLIVQKIQQYVIVGSWSKLKGRSGEEFEILGRNFDTPVLRENEIETRQSDGTKNLRTV